MFILNKEAYTSKDWFKKEQDIIFSNTWQFVGFVEDFEKIGTHKCFNIGKHHIIITKDKTGKLHALHAECRHRGNILDPKQSNKRNIIVCPYHNWTYDLTGKLIGVPERKDIKLTKDLGLRKASISVFKTLVFVNPDPSYEPLEEYLKPLIPHLGPHIPEDLMEYKEKYNSYIVDCNWKIFVENYIDGYHLDYLHKNTLNMYDHKKQESKFVGKHWTFVEPLTNDYLLSIKKNKSYYKPLKQLSEEQYKAHVHLVYPNFGITETESTWTIMTIEPINESQTKLTFRTRLDKNLAKKTSSVVHSETPIRTSDYKDPLNSGDFMIEDMFVCENIQKAINNDSYKPGPHHESKEDAILKFQEIIKNHMNI